MEIGNRIRACRIDNNLSQEKLAEKLHVSRQTVSNWENGKTYPDIHMIIAVSILFNISLDLLLKNDLEEIKMALAKNNAILRSKFHAYIMLFFTFLAACSLGLVIVFKKDAIFLLFPLLIYLPAFFSSLKLEMIKKDNNLKNYQEISDFMENKDVIHGDKTKEPFYHSLAFIIFGYVTSFIIITGVLIVIIKTLLNI